MIEVRGLTKRFGEKKALDDLSFTVREGVAYGFLGRNGAGKTTMIRILMNIFREDSGEALIDGAPAWKEMRRIGYLPEERGLYSKRTVIDQLIYLGKLKGMNPKTVDRDARVKLAEMDAAEYTDKKMETLSKGNQQKIQLAVALLGEPDIVILDEPFSGLDPINAQILKDAVRRQVSMNKTVIFSSHQMGQVEEFCDDICIIDAGHAILEGNLSEIKRSYPRNRIYIAADADGAAGGAAGAEKLSALLRDLPFVRAAEPYEAGLAVTIDEPGKKRALLQAAVGAGLSIDVFSVIEPTLEQIFVEKAGHGNPRGENK
ncbi:MAG: ATP-binding cassette domain-containing protein [Clostridiales Family XIII bacterium]|jgi:ABC-2 type transport system ATP-binding protein|nr:ATP-binding cassette domain-containing protein [Clostridiales Family XIII bacterium]